MIFEPRKPDFLTDIVPVLGTVVALISILKDQPYVAGISLVVVAIALAFKYGGPLYARIRRRVARSRDKRLLRRASRQLQHFVAEFGKFLSLSDRMPNPYMIVSSAAHQGQTKGPFDFDRLRLIHPEVPARFLAVLLERWTEETRNASEVRNNFREFHEILETFDRGQLLAIFHNDADKLRQALSEQARSELNAAREEYVDFHRRYREFVRELNGRLAEYIMPFGGQPPKPL